MIIIQVIIDEPIKTETDNKGLQTNEEIKTNNSSHTEPDKEYAERYLTDGSNLNCSWYYYRSRF